MPENVKLTTRDGRIFHLNLKTGVTHLEDLNGNALDITPDGITHSSGRGVEFVRDERGRIAKIIDPKGTENVYTYDDATDDLLVHRDRSGAETQFTYGENHYLEDIHNALGIRAVRTEYDESGRMVRMIDAAGKAIELDHQLGDRREVVTNRLGHTRVLDYDRRGNIVREENELGHVTERSYDSDDNLLSEKDPLGRITTYGYDPATNDLLSVTNPADEVTRFTYHALGLPQTITDPLGHVTRNAYSASGNLERTIDAQGEATVFEYNPRGDLKKVTDALNHTTSYTYDDQGHVLTETNAEGNARTYTYDDHGNRLSKTRQRTVPTPEGGTETVTDTSHYVYDELDRAIEVVAADGGRNKTDYDPLGRILRQIDAKGRATSYGYDTRGRNTWVSAPDGTQVIPRLR